MTGAGEAANVVEKPTAPAIDAPKTSAQNAPQVQRRVLDLQTAKR
jgi:hypothetical protein